MNPFVTLTKLVFLVAILLSASNALAQFGPDRSARSDTLDSIVAVVNDDIITRSELTVAIARVTQQLQRRNAEIPAESILERQVLENLIVTQLQLREAERRGIVVDDPSLNAAVNTIAQNNNMTLDQLRLALQRDGMSYADLREQVRRDLLTTRLRQREIDSRVNVSQQEVDNVLNNSNSSPLIADNPEQRSATQRDAARQQLFRRKVEQEWQQWLQQLRDEAYVEIRL